jgi:radical SAM protein with 4Fe4S-binding SPASM domain
MLKRAKHQFFRLGVSLFRVSLEFPIILYFETAANCNFSCAMCPQGYDKLQGNKFMSWETFKKGMDESLAHGPRMGLFFHERGEPLLNPLTVEMIEYACGRNGAHATHLSTNGYFMTEDISRRLIRSGLKSVSISIDAIDRETFRRIKGVDAYDRVAANVDALIRLKKELGSITPMVRPKLITMKDNQGQAAAFRKRWEKADDVIISDFFFWADARDILAQYTGDESILATNICIMPWTSMLVSFDGSVTVCCVDYENQVLIGNINSQSLREIWHNPKLVEMRRAFLKGDKTVFPICANCRYFDRKHSLANSAEQALTRSVLKIKGC